MMIQVRKHDKRGKVDHGWLEAHHTFSFGKYRDPEHVQYRDLRVLNEDRIAPAAGFPTHPHRDMEIITYVLEGSLAHRDSMGHEAVIPAGSFQKMTAGSGITHSEFNGSDTTPVHLYQVWIRPDRPGLKPSYDQRDISELPTRDGWIVVASPDVTDGAIEIKQDALVLLGRIDESSRLAHDLAHDRGAWLQVTKGHVTVNERQLVAGDGASIEGPARIELGGEAGAEVLLFDLN